MAHRLKRPDSRYFYLVHFQKHQKWLHDNARSELAACSWRLLILKVLHDLSMRYIHSVQFKDTAWWPEKHSLYVSRLLMYLYFFSLTWSDFVSDCHSHHFDYSSYYCYGLAVFFMSPAIESFSYWKVVRNRGMMLCARRLGWHWWHARKKWKRSLPNQQKILCHF